MSFRRVLNTVSQTANTVSTGLRTTQRLASDIQSGNIGRTLRTTRSLLGLINGTSNGEMTQANFPSAGDWRVRLSMPSHPAYSASPLLAPLESTNGLVWPYTPTVNIVHSANYNAISPTHTNYSTQAYKNSTVDQITVSGQFFNETEEEAKYWLGMLQYLRSVTKMAYGQGNGDLQGAPPPVLRFSGYGDYVFNGVPVVVSNFTLDLSPDTDYISVNVGGSTSALSSSIQALNKTGAQIPGAQNGNVHVPVQSLVSVTLVPTYSRREQEKFNFKDFVSGSLVKGGGYI
jgi:hypothetical protein